MRRTNQQTNEEERKIRDKEYRLCWFRLNYAVRYDTVDDDDEDKHDHSGEQCKKCKEKGGINKNVST